MNLIETMKLAVDALQNAGSSSYSAKQLSMAITELRTAIAELEKAEPVAEVTSSENLWMR